MNSNETSPFLTLGLSQSGSGQWKRRLDPPGEKIALPERIAKWKPERELAGPVPRRTRFRLELTSQRSLGFIVFFAAVIGVLLLPTLRDTPIGDQEGFFVWFYFLLIFAGVLIIGLLFWTAFDSHRRLSKSLVSEGTAARGVVISVRKYTHTPVRPQATDVPRYDHVIAFDAPERRYLELNAERKELPVGHALTILYLPDAPELAMPYMRCCYEAL